MTYNAKNYTEQGGERTVIGGALEVLPEALVLGVLRVTEVVATLAELNSGKVLIPGVAGHRIRVTDYTMHVTGTFTDGVALGLSDGDSNAIGGALIADLADGDIVRPGVGGGLVSSYLGRGLPAGAGLTAKFSGTATGGTSIRFVLSHTLEAA